MAATRARRLARKNPRATGRGKEARVAPADALARCVAKAGRSARKKEATRAMVPLEDVRQDEFLLARV